MVAQPSRQFMRVDEWRELEQNSHDSKYEYIDGQVYLISGGSRTHSRIGSNAGRTLEDALAGSPCNVYNSDACMRVSQTRYTYPDVSVHVMSVTNQHPMKMKFSFPALLSRSSQNPPKLTTVVKSFVIIVLAQPLTNMFSSPQNINPSKYIAAPHKAGHLITPMALVTKSSSLALVYTSL